VGSINTQDGVDLLVRAVHILVNELGRSRVHCTVVGAGDDLRRVKRLCRELGMESYFTFTGYVYERGRVKKYIDEADICLETAPASEVNRRSTFIKIMEYMSAGRPIVAFDLEETRFSADGAAVLVEQGNLRGFSEAIVSLANDVALRERLGEAGRRRIEADLNWDNASKELIAAYRYLNMALHK
jgi:glycosyltransferase involved in cell wall biosynthesis